MLAFVEYCIYDVITQLLKQEGLEDTSANRSAMESKIRTEGYNIYTTIDPEKQKAAEQAVYNYKNIRLCATARINIPFRDAIPTAAL